MIDSGNGVYIGIVILGAVIVIITAFLIIKSTSKKGIAQTQEQPLENIETAVVQKKRLVPAFRLGLSRLKFSSRLVLRKFSRLRHNASLDEEPDAEDPAINEQFSIPLPSVISPEPGANEAPSSPEQETPNDEDPAINEQFSIPLPSVISTGPGANETPSSPEQETPDDEEPAINEQFSIPLPSVISPEPEANEAPSSLEQETPDVEPPDEEEPEEPDEAYDDEHQEPSTNKDSVFDLFSTEVVEDSDVSKLAANLNNLDAHDLLEEAQNLMNRLRGARG